MNIKFNNPVKLFSQRITVKSYYHIYINYRVGVDLITNNGSIIQLPFHHVKFILKCQSGIKQCHLNVLANVNNRFNSAISIS